MVGRSGSGEGEGVSSVRSITTFPFLLPLLVAGEQERVRLPKIGLVVKRGRGVRDRALRRIGEEGVATLRSEILEREMVGGAEGMASSER